MRLLIVGLGDLSERICQYLLPCEIDVIVATRNYPRAKSFANMLSAIGGQEVPSFFVDLQDPSSIRTLLREVAPDVVLNTASMLSPWMVPLSQNTAIQSLAASGFACQFSAHLPLLLSLMRVIRDYPRDIFVINASYPDLTHPVLAKLGLSPNVGIGNIGMIERIIERNLALLPIRKSFPETERLNIIAHHAQVSSVLSACRGEHASMPLIFDHDSGQGLDASICYEGKAITPQQSINMLSAFLAARLIQIIFSGRHEGFHAPGPNGLPGGYKVSLSGQKLSIMVPRGRSLNELITTNEKFALLDGIAHIDDNGTVHYTADAARTISAPFRFLTSPLRPTDSLERFTYFREALLNAAAY